MTTIKLEKLKPRDFITWGKVVHFHEQLVYDGYNKLSSDFSDTVMKSSDYTIISVNSDFHYVITGQVTNAARNSLISFFTSNFKNPIYYHKLKLFFADSNEAMLFKLKFDVKSGHMYAKL